jgi:hypothetical protein
MFIGCLTTAKSSFTSADIRALSEVSTKATRNEQSFTAPIGTAQIVIAYPAALTSDSPVKPTYKAFNMGQWQTENEYNIQQHHMGNTVGAVSNALSVDGATSNTGAPYYVYSYTPPSAFTAETEYKIEI